MRLKGGKVLIDCSDIDLIDADIEKTITKEEYDVIKQKGLALYLNIGNHKFYYEPLFNSISFINDLETISTTGQTNLTVTLPDDNQPVWIFSLNKQANDTYVLNIMEG